MITAVECVMNGLRPWVQVPVSTLVPRQRPELFVRVDSGAPVAISPVSDKTMIIVQVYGDDLEKVLNLISEIREFLRLEITLTEPEVSGWDEESGPHDFPDPDIEDSVFRWQLAGYVFTTSTY